MIDIDDIRLMKKYWNIHKESVCLFYGIDDNDDEI